MSFFIFIFYLLIMMMISLAVSGLINYEYSGFPPGETVLFLLYYL